MVQKYSHVFMDTIERAFYFAKIFKYQVLNQVYGGYLYCLQKFCIISIKQ